MSSAILAGIALGVAATMGVLLGLRVLAPYVFALRRGFIETPEERRNRKFRVAVAIAHELAMDPSVPPRHTFVWARRACRIKPGHPMALLSLGVSLNRLGHHERALKALERGLQAQLEGQHANCGAPGFLVKLALESVRACSALRNEAGGELSREQWGEVALHWIRLVIDLDPEGAADFPDVPELRDLAPAARMMLQSNATPSAPA